jgi:hypothetical protein
VERSKPDSEVARIGERILLVRGVRVIVDADLAQLYGVPTKALNQQVRRNWDRFPDDFAFRLTKEEKAELVTKCDHLGNLKHSKALPLAFTEHGALMAANVLKSKRAVEVSVFVVRAFVRLREMIEQNREIARRLRQLESRVAEHDGQILSLVRAIRQLAVPDDVPAKRRIGFGKK